MIALMLVAALLGGVNSMHVATIPSWVTPCLGEPADSPCNSGRGNWQ